MIRELRNNPKRLIRQVIAAWLVLHASVTLFVIIALLFSLAISNQELVIIMAFFLTAIFTVRAHIWLYKTDYHLLTKKQNSFSLQDNEDLSPPLTIRLEELKLFFIWVISNFIEGVFLILWVLGQQLVNYLVTNFQLFGLEREILVVIQFLFAIVTLVPILTLICLSIIRSLKQAQLLIWKELGR